MQLLFHCLKTVTILANNSKTQNTDIQTFASRAHLQHSLTYLMVLTKNVCHSLEQGCTTSTITLRGGGSKAEGGHNREGSQQQGVQAL